MEMSSDIISSLIGAGADYIIGTQNAFLGDYFGRKQRSQQSKLSYEMANYEAALNYQYSKLYNEQNFALAQRYAQNSAKWSVDGLRNAGLNPILAAGGGFNANLGSAGVTSDTSVDMPGMSANPSVGMPGRFTEALGLLNNIKETNSRVKLNEEQEPLIEANTAKVNAEADRIRRLTDAEVQSMKLKNQEQLNKNYEFFTTYGHESPWTALGSSILHEYSNKVNSAKQFVKGVYDYLKTHLHSSPVTNSSKDVRQIHIPESGEDWWKRHTNRSIHDFDYNFRGE